jgi:GGDEF domain-containing protein
MDPNSHHAEDGPERRPRVVAVSGLPLGGAGASIPPRFERQLRGAARRRRGTESHWVAIAKVNGVTEIRSEYGDPAAEEFLRGTASVLRTSLREADKLAPVGRGEYGIILDAPRGDDVVAGLERLVENVRALAGRDRRWSVGSLSIGVAPLWSDEPAAVLERAHAALERATKRGGSLVMMSTQAR